MAAGNCRVSSWPEACDRWVTTEVGAACARALTRLLQVGIWMTPNEMSAFVEALDQVRACFTESVASVTMFTVIGAASL
jgi:hypothetical protein